MWETLRHRMSTCSCPACSGFDATLKRSAHVERNLLLMFLAGRAWTRQPVNPRCPESRNGRPRRDCEHSCSSLSLACIPVRRGCHRFCCDSASRSRRARRARNDRSTCACSTRHACGVIAGGEIDTCRRRTGGIRGSAATCDITRRSTIATSFVAGSSPKLVDSHDRQHPLRSTRGVRISAHAGWRMGRDRPPGPSHEACHCGHSVESA